MLNRWTILNSRRVINSSWHLYAKRWVAALLVTGGLLVSASCDAPLQKQIKADDFIKQLDAYRPEQLSLHTIQNLQQQLSQPLPLELLVTWALDHPQKFAALMANAGNETLNTKLAAKAVEMGKSFLFLERLANPEGHVVADLLQRIELLEHRDRRSKVLSRRLELSSPLTRIVKFQGHDGQAQWQGAALLLVESECQLGLATAGHNLLTEKGALRAPLKNLNVEIGGVSHPLVELLSTQSPVEPEQDWVIAITNKTDCGKPYGSSELALADNTALPDSGMAVGLYCFHQGEQDVMASLYQEQCDIFPANAGVLDHYQNRSGNKLGIHSCVSEKGSSGCPILYQDQGATYFLATQIERDSITGAGIARLFSDDFLCVLSAVEIAL